MAFRPKRLQPGDMITAKAKNDAGRHPVLGPIIEGQEYTVAAEHFPLELLERPANVLFPFEAEPAQETIIEGGDA